nr:putative capsid protein [Crucivirus sp.]
MPAPKKEYVARKPRKPRKSTRSYKPRYEQIPVISPAPAPKKGSLGRSLLKASGGLLGGLFGKTGSSLGSKLAGGLSNIVGLGEYKIEHNSLLEDPPRIKNPSHPGETVLKHREYLGDLISHITPNTFKIQSFPLNPAQPSTFPWLSQIAANYEQYRFEGCIFEFKSMSADALNSVNTALGSVIMATSYNAANPPFQTKSEMENYEFGMSCKPSSSMMHPIECARMQTSLDELYTRPGSGAGLDIRLYDLGNFQIATTGCQGSQVNLGEIWVTFQVGLLKPKLYSSLGNSNLMFSWMNDTFSPADPFGITAGPVNPVVYPISKANSLQVTITSGDIYLPQSQVVQSFLLSLSWDGNTAGFLSPPTLTGFGGLVIDGVLNGPVTQPTAGAELMQGPWIGDEAFQGCFTYFIQTRGGGSYPIIRVGNDGIYPGEPIFVAVKLIQLPNQYYKVPVIGALAPFTDYTKASYV